MINPIAFSFGSIHVRWYGIFMATAFSLGIWQAYWRAGKIGIAVNHIIDMVTLIIPVSVLCARLYYVVFEWQDHYAQQPWEALAIWHGGLAIHGGLIGGILAGVYYVKKHQLSVWQMADVCAPSVILGQAIGRWGNFTNQEAHGGPVSQQFISHFPSFIQNQMFINGQYYHPTFLYESLWNFAVFALLFFLWPRKQFVGQIALLYIGFYSVGRYFVEGMRTDSLMWGSFRVAQLMSLTLILISIAGLIYLRSKQKAEKSLGKQI